MWSTVLGVLVAVKSGNPWFFPVPLLSLGALSYIPFVTRLRRVLRDGYVVDDLHAALKEHALVRSEEIEYERSQQSSSMLTGISKSARPSARAAASACSSTAASTRHTAVRSPLAILR